MRRLALSAAATLAGLALLGAPASAAVIKPTVLTDDNTDNGNCTLREAVISANTDSSDDACTEGSGQDIIRLRKGTHRLTLGGVDEVDAAFGDLDLTDDVEIFGHRKGSTVRGDGIERVFEVRHVTYAFIDGITITGGGPFSNGGGILVVDTGSLALYNSTVRGNTGGVRGGGLMISGQATVFASTIKGNSASSEGDGGGIAASGVGADLRIGNSTIEGNTAPGQGGGIYAKDGADLIIGNTTITGNEALSDASNGGGGVQLVGAASASIQQSTITGNSAQFGGGLHVNGATATVEGTILADNTATISGPDCGGPGTLNGAGDNLLGDSALCPLATDPALRDISPLLRPLRDNGGPTRTHALRPSSPARGERVLGGAPTGGYFEKNSDQRGAPRGSKRDIGAYEFVRCGGVIVNRVGSSGDDVLTGTPGRDGFLGLRGKDMIKGGDGRDAACGGLDRDTIRLGKGNDKLFGEEGGDLLIGGPGRDLCDGGPGRDRARGCERRRAIP